MSERSLLLTVPEVAELLSVSRATAYEMVHADGALRPYTVRIGAGSTGLRVLRSGIDEWLAKSLGKVDTEVSNRDERTPIEWRIIDGELRARNRA